VSVREPVSGGVCKSDCEWAGCEWAFAAAVAAFAAAAFAALSSDSLVLEFIRSTFT